MPYEKQVSAVTLAAMGMVIGALRSSIRVPFGAEAIFDGGATIELCAAVEADFTRCLFTGVWAGDFGLVDRDIARTLRLKNAYRLDDLKLFYFVTSEGDASVDNPKPGWFSQDADAIWWGDFCKLSRKLVQRAREVEQDVACVGLSALGCDCVPIGEDGKSLCDAILYGVDSRNTKEIEWVTEHYGKENAEKLFGHEPCSSDVAPKILCLKINIPTFGKKLINF